MRGFCHLTVRKREEEQVSPGVTIRRETHRRPPASAVIAAACAVIVLAGGSCLVAYLLVVTLHGLDGAAPEEGAAAGLVLLWPATVLGVGLLSAVALVKVQRSDMLMHLLTACVLSSVALIGLLTLVGGNPYTRQSLPLRGGAAVVVLALFIGLTAGVPRAMVYVVLHRARPR